MDVTAIRWESLALIAGIIILAVWALADATRDAPARREGSVRQIMFEVRRPGEEPQVVRFDGNAVLGRGPACHMVFHDSTVSKEHARLMVAGARVVIEDLQSTNGTLVNGRAIEGPTALRPGDRIGLGSNVIWFLGETSPHDSREIV